MPKVSLAVLPPDVVVSVGAQVAGFFSLIVAVIVSLFASLAVMYFWWYEWCKRNSIYIAFGVLAVALVVSNVFYIWQLQSLTNQGPIVFTVPEKPSDLSPQHPPQPATDTERNPADECQTCEFYSDSITLYVPSLNRPFVLELDMNRRQEPNTSFTHYYFLDGLINAQPTEQYVQHSEMGYELSPESFLTNIERIRPADASVRDTYRGAVLTEQNEKVSFQIDTLQGDFISRNLPEYTQFQSVADATVSLNGEELTAYALVENLISNNFEKKIFFPGLDAVEALTYQFVLWDEDGNFYLIDKSEVFSDSPDYPSHTWILFKNTKTGEAKKSFTADITTVSDTQWIVQLPDLLGASLELSVQNQYQEERDGRSRFIVRGVVTDDSGTRTISGLLRKVQ